MKNKTILIIGVSAVAAVIAVALLIVSLNKKTATNSVTQKPAGSTGSGNISTGASPDLATLGNGTIAVNTPKTDSTQPYATTAPRVESPLKTSGNGVALQPASGSSQPTTTPTEVAYNYNQTDNSFLNTYYPDAKQVITGNQGPQGNIGQDSGNQVLYTTTPATPNGPVLTLPSGFDTSTLKTSSDNSPAAIKKYLQALTAATASFDVVHNSGLITAPLQAQDARAASNNGIEAASILQAIQVIPVPTTVIDLQASYIDSYQQYITYAGELSSFLSSGNNAVSSQESALQTIAGTISTAISTAAGNYQSVSQYYNK